MTGKFITTFTQQTTLDKTMNKALKALVITAFTATLALPQVYAAKKNTQKDTFPDGTEISEWFRNTDAVKLNKLGKQYKLTDYGIFSNGRVHTAEIQALIDKAAQNGGIFLLILYYNF